MNNVSVHHKKTAEIVSHPRQFSSLQQAIGRMGQELENQAREMAENKKQGQALSDAIERLENSAQMYVEALKDIRGTNNTLGRRSHRLIRIMDDACAPRQLSTAV